MSENIEACIKKVDKVLENELNIPEYQRPYRWTEANVRQLLYDVHESWKLGKNSYRIGSIILHTEKNNLLNIVDGQQRLTTILLVLAALGSSVGKDLRSKLKYNHIDSKNAISKNKIFIDKWINENIQIEKDDFCKYLTQYCEFVEIKVQDLSEAFQMFDSQNGRGKELEAYNLLKAYHIRAMESNTFDEKIYCDRNWENATRFLNNPKNQTDVFDILKQLFNEQLYRTRLWSRKDVAWNFDKKKISEFKGISINKNNAMQFPFQNRELLQYVMQNYFHSIGVDVKGIKSRFAHINPENVNPFVLLNQNIINGKNFFEYIESYVEIYKQLFKSNDKTVLHEFKSFYKEYCTDYKGAHRDGDKYLLELYKSLVFILFDKFGEEGVNKYYRTLYALVYRVRLEKMQVKYPAIAEYPASSQIFHTIETANTFLELQRLEQISYDEIKCQKEVSKILQFFFNQGVSVITEDTNINLDQYKHHDGN